ncbi:acetyl-CoA hydrolase/transferase C-terminal domain-containing protein [uncultured Albimonas sp.]|uniref:acetyl-CoA hydrolase/transferase family protein n=1 Tax=uncultured Albimonas sp. TaxID=1331701 RepID=UPI0030EDA09D|tara:strand:+ start:8961 stop:10247 length:1287 start_codon:yes stop_codon:yes gene_type:complete
MSTPPPAPRSPALLRVRPQSAARFPGLLSAGERLFLPGSAAEVPALLEALHAQGGPALRITSSFVPGINPTPLGRLPPGTEYSALFATADAPGDQARGALRHLPMSYGAAARWLGQVARFDACVMTVAPPDAAGRCSLGLAVEFAPLARRRSSRLILVVNPAMPSIPGAASVALDEADAVIEAEAPPREYDVGAPSPAATAIAGRIATLVDDGAAIQIGLGKAPDALMDLLTDRRNLRLHSGMLSDGARRLVEAGALAPGHRPVSCVHVGTRSYYDWLAGRDGFDVVDCEATHTPQALARVRGLVAVNSALEVDLFGQANLELLGGRAISGVGGAPDFARAAALDPASVSVVALPAASGRGAVSRIVPRLSGLASLPRGDVEVVITEHGLADLRGLSTVERAERLIEVAAPDHRPALTEAWRAMAAGL